MKKSSKINTQTMPRITPGQVIKSVVILTIVITIILSAKDPVLAQTNPQSNTEDVSPTQYYFYLPLTERADPAHYVSPEGNDNNPGSLLRPWKTISKAANTVSPGDIIYIRGGIYHERVYIYTSGTESAPIKFLAYPGETPVIDGDNIRPEIGGSLLRIIGDYLYTTGIEIRNSAYEGIRVQGDFDVVTDMFVHHSMATGITITEGRYSLVENCRVWRNSLANEYGQYQPWDAGLSATRNGVSHATIRRNTVWENWGEGVSSSSADQIIIEDNIIHDNYAANLYLTSSTNLLVQRNFVYTDPNSYVFPYSDHGGIMIGDETYDPPNANITIINNISVGNQGNFWWWQGSQGGGMYNVLIANNSFINAIGSINDYRGGVIIDSGDHVNVRFQNNLIKQDGDLPVIMTHPQAGVTYSNNLWSKTPPFAASGPGDVIGDPQFARLGNPYTPEWYKITALSPAIDKALSLSVVNVDYFGSEREAPPDMGANEFFLYP